ncbi:M48 family metallopeptidase [Reinekea sp. G2M2-21]|uniref:M48 family metallopeptidase n=1 Tax=Reinekea sp. G2M2-21 TaxID=2788942 RepID=UPI0018ABBD20|nr:M48 family metallopeptidase [Reinekea sp. G2M2-21]
MTDDQEPMPSQNPVIPEGINAVRENPFKELLLLTTGIAVALVIVSLVLWQSLSWGAKFIPLSWEMRISDSIAQQFEDTSEQSMMLQARLDHILQAMEYDGKVPLQVHYVDDDLVNAFATIGGHIFVFRGLMDILQTDIGLDMVLAHEAAHILNRDPIQSLAGAVGVQLVVALITGNGDFGQMNGIIDMGNQLMFLTYSREQERVADAMALDALASLYDDLTGADELFVWFAQDDNDAPEFLSSHPLPDARIEAIRNRLSQ